MINVDVLFQPHAADPGPVTLAEGSYPIEYTFFNATNGTEGEISAIHLGFGTSYILFGDDASGGLDVTQVPEPTATMLLLLTAAGMSLVRRSNALSVS